MPKAIEKRLRKKAKKKGIKDIDAYVYGTLKKLGWKSKKKKTRVKHGKS